MCPLQVGQSNIGIALLSLFCAVVFPVCRSCLALVLWFSSLGPSTRKRIVAIIDVLGLYAGADVYSICLLVMVWQLPKLFENMEEASQYVHLTMAPLSGLAAYTFGALLDVVAIQSVLDLHEAVAADKEERRPTPASSMPLGPSAAGHFGQSNGGEEEKAA